MPQKTRVEQVVRTLKVVIEARDVWAISREQVGGRATILVGGVDSCQRQPTYP